MTAFQFLENSLLAYRALFVWLRPESYVALRILFPTGQLLLFTLLGRYALGEEAIPFFVTGNAVVVVALNGIYGVSIALTRERVEGLLPQLLASPANRTLMLLSKAFVHVFDGLLTASFVLLLGSILFHLEVSQAHWLMLLIALLVASFSVASFGLIVGSLVLLWRDSGLMMNTVYFALLVVTGVNVPRPMLPPWANVIGQFLPITRSVEVVRAAIQGASVDPTLLIQELGLGALYLSLGVMLSKWIEFLSRRRGTLEIQ